MSDAITPASLKSLLSQIEPSRPAPSRAAEPARPDAARVAKAEERVNVPKDAVRLDPNAPRGTYLNLTV
ncbi:MAG: hypothetical protein JJ899_03960 [Alphaproteobacteria bacterium]|nr:hypothetical protein [Alphaproteobacteria bacterium]